MLKYTEDHEWLRAEGDEIVVGITRHASEQLGDVGFVELPEEGKALAKLRADVGMVFQSFNLVPTLTALAVGWVRAKPGSAAARGFDWARAHPEPVTAGATWAVAVLLVVLGVTHMM